jgi:hypothetical protein
MTGSKTTSVEDASQRADEGSRQRSSISFPYVDLGAGLDLASAVHGHVGHGECEEDQLAARTNQSPKSNQCRPPIRRYQKVTFSHECE